MRATSFEISPEVLFWAVVAGVVPTEPKSDISRCDDSALFSVLLFSLGAGAERGRRKGKRGVSETQAMKKRNKRRKRRKGLPSERSSLSGSVQRGGGSNEAKRALISQKGILQPEADIQANSAIVANITNRANRTYGTNQTNSPQLAHRLSQMHHHHHERNPNRINSIVCSRSMALTRASIQSLRL